MVRAAVIGLAACGASDPPARVCPPSEGPLLWASTTDYQVGALAAVDPEAGALYDGLASAWPDSLVRVAGDTPVVIGRGEADALRIYGDRCFGSPDREVPLPERTNAHDLVALADQWFLSAYDADHLLVVDPLGAVRGEVDLAPWADADGTPDPDQLVVVGGEVVVALQNLLGNFDEAGEGRLARVDPASLTVIDAIDVGPNPKLYPHPADPAAVVVLTGLYYGEAADGEVLRVVPATGEVTPVAQASDLGFDLSDYAEAAGHGVLVGVDVADASRSVVRCVDWATGTWRDGPAMSSWIADLAGTPDGLVWAVARSGQVDGAASGIFALDPVSCAIVSEWVAPALQPYSLAYLP